MTLSSHPLPPSSFRAEALRRIYESTPPTPKTGPVGAVGQAGPGPHRAAGLRPHRSTRADAPRLASLSDLVADLELPVPIQTPAPPDARHLLGSRFALERELDAGGTAVIWLAR